MQMVLKRKKTACVVFFATVLFGQVHAGDNNPATIAYVEALIFDATLKTLYTAGNNTILIDKNYIYGNYQAGDGIIITDNIISSPDSIPLVGQGAVKIRAGALENTIYTTFQGAQSLLVQNTDPNNASQGLITGYTNPLGSGLSIGATTGSAPGQIGVNLVVAPTYSIALAPSMTAGDTSVTISGHYEAGAGVVFGTGSPVTIGGNYVGANGIFVDYSPTSPDPANIYGYTTADGSGITIGAASDPNGGAISANIKAPSTSSVTIASSTSSNNLDITSKATFTLGECYQGGIIFYLDASNQHGLAVSVQQPGSAEFNHNDYRTYNTGNGIGAGFIATQSLMASGGQKDDSSIASSSSLTNNTTALGGTFQYAVGSNGTSNCSFSASQLYTPSSGECFGGWYLPSIYEMQLLFQNNAEFSGSTACNATIPANGLSGTYWTSDSYTDGSTNLCNGGSNTSNCMYTVNSATAFAVYDKSSTLNYRPIRSF